MMDLYPRQVDTRVVENKILKTPKSAPPSYVLVIQHLSRYSTKGIEVVS